MAAVAYGTTWGKVFEDEGALTCGACGDYFNDPRLLDCLHTMCMACIISKGGFFKAGVGAVARSALPNAAAPASAWRPQRDLPELQ